MPGRPIKPLRSLSAWLADLQGQLRANAEANWGDAPPATALGPAVMYRSMRMAFGPQGGRRGPVECDPRGCRNCGAA